MVDKDLIKKLVKCSDDDLKHITDFSFDNKYNEVMPFEYCRSVEGSFELNYTYDHCHRISAKGEYRYEQSYENRCDPHIESKLIFNIDGEIIELDFDEVDNWLEDDELNDPNKQHLVLLDKFCRKYEWTYLMSIKIK